MPLFVWPSDIAAEQERLKAKLDAYNAVVASCTGLDPVTLAGWNAFYTAASDFCSKTPTWIPWPGNTSWASPNMGNTVVSYEKEMLAWQQKLSAKCQSDVPLFSVYDPSSGSAGVGDTVVSVLKFGAIIAVAVGGAYVVKKGVELAREFHKSKELPE